MSNQTKKPLRGYKSRSSTVHLKSSRRAQQRWTFEKAEKRPCVTYHVPIDQLDKLDQFDVVDVNASKAESKVETQAVPTITANVITETKTPFEIECSRKLAALLSGETEAVTEAGRVDVLTSEAVIELKQARNWKHGIGQLLAYGFYFPEKTLALVLIGSDAPQFLDIARFHCDRFSIQVSIFNF